MRFLLTLRGSGKFAGDLQDRFSPEKSNAIAEDDGHGRKSERSQNNPNTPGREILVTG